MQDADSLVHARWILPVEPEQAVLEHHCVVIRAGRIQALLPSDQARCEYRTATQVSLTGHALIPGLINAHTHAAMTLLRGLADDLPLMAWLNDHIWPAERRWVDPGFVRDGTLLAAAEMLRGGVTCFNDMYFFPEHTADAATEAGMRACVGLIVLDFPTIWAASPEEYLRKASEAHERLRHRPLVRTAFAPHAPYSVSDAPLERVRVLAEELDLPIHIHIHETRDEVEQSLHRHGVRPLERLARLGLLSPRLLGVHMTRVMDEEIQAYARTGAHLVHCPESNMKLASGLCPVQRFLDAGVNVALGTDGAASNNDLDLFGEMRSAALLGKAVARDAAALPAHRVLRMATLNGARALGLDDEIGSLRPGKAADLVAVDLSTVSTQPVYHPLSHLIYAAGREQVSDVWVAGRRVVQHGRLVTLDQAELLDRVRARGERIAAGDTAAQRDR
jgi:5-methylthioadenosine/S-adenosylhomocysteine deaminase